VLINCESSIGAFFLTTLLHFYLVIIPYIIILFPALAEYAEYQP
jgi:hypothetical protein